MELWENIIFFLGLMLDGKIIVYAIVLHIYLSKYKKELKQVVRNERKFGDRKKAKELISQTNELFQYLRGEGMQVIVFSIAKLFLYSIEDYLTIVCGISVKNTIVPLVIVVIGSGFSFISQIIVSRIYTLLVEHRIQIRVHLVRL